MKRLFFLFLLTPLAFAHRPQPAEEKTEISEPGISHVIGGVFTSGVEVFRVILPFEEPFALPMELMVPWRLEAHRPVFAVMGPGLPEPTAEQREWLPLEVPEGSGVIIELNDDEEREVYFERVMRRTMHTSGSLAMHLPAASTYEVWIWSPEFTVGEFWFGFGVEEDFSDPDVWDPLFENWGLFGW